MPPAASVRDFHSAALTGRFPARPRVPAGAMSVGTALMIAIPVAAFMGPVAMIVGHRPRPRCNDRGHGRPMIAIRGADDCGSLHIAALPCDWRWPGRDVGTHHDSSPGPQPLDGRRCWALRTRKAVEARRGLVRLGGARPGRVRPGGRSRLTRAGRIQPPLVCRLGWSG